MEWGVLALALCSSSSCHHEGNMMGTHTTTTTTSTERGLRTRLLESFQRCAPPDFNAKTSSPSSLQQTKDEEGDILDDIDDIDVEVGDGRGASGAGGRRERATGPSRAGDTEWSGWWDTVPRGGPSVPR